MGSLPYRHLKLHFGLRSAISTVHCRTGSLESRYELHRLNKNVHCRTGSLEKNPGGRDGVKTVHCRTGGRNLQACCKYERDRALPYRQLRKITIVRSIETLSSLPYRQLEIFNPSLKDIVCVHCRTGSLERKPPARRRENRFHCRTGSLEKSDTVFPSVQYVHCRTGSLENNLNSLPCHRCA